MTTSQAPVVPATTTHIWTPAIDIPIVGGLFRRAFYRKTLGNWYSYSINKEWIKTNNPPEWFKEEKTLGYFVTIKKFNSPNFVSVKENVR